MYAFSHLWAVSPVLYIHLRKRPTTHLPKPASNGNPAKGSISMEALKKAVKCQRV